MDSYAANGTIAAVSAAGASALGVIASTSTRGRVHYFALSVGGTPVGDTILRWLIRRFSADGTGTGLTPEKLDLAAPASLMTAKQNYTAEPTYLATILFDLALHMRNIYHWNAAPGKELVVPPTASAGIGVTPSHATYTGSAQGTIHWTE